MLAVMMSAVINSFTLAVLFRMCERHYALTVIIYAVMGLFAIVVVFLHTGYGDRRFYPGIDNLI